MSPEQASGRDVDQRSDIFSLGVVLYELLTGKLPFRGDHEAAVLYGIMNSDPVPLATYKADLPPGLQRVVEKALCKDPDSRYQTVLDMRADLEAVRTGSELVGLGIQRRTKRTLRIAVPVLVVAFIVVGGYAGLRQFFRSGTPTAIERAPNPITIAVLPFVNLSSDDEQEYFSDGLTEELMNALVKIPELRVTGRTSSFFFKGKDEDLQTISQKLGVANVLEGSVRKTGNNIKITAQLIETKSGFQLWSEIYDRTLDDIFTVQTDIARSVARMLAVALPDEETSEAKRSDAEVHDLVMRARFTMGVDRTQEGANRARQIIERALAINPDYAPAWVAMNSVYQMESGLREIWRQPIEERNKFLDARREVLGKALSLDPELAEAHARMAVVNVMSKDFEAARRSVDRAMELDPRNPAVMQPVTAVYRWLGRTDAALSLAEQSVKADPLSYAYYANLAECYLYVGRLDDAEATCRRVLELGPEYGVAHDILARVHLYQGRLAEAREEWEAWDRYSGQSPASDDDRLWRNALLEHSAGNTSSSDAALAEYEEDYGEKDPVGCAQIHAWRGETDQAFQWLEKAYPLVDLTTLQADHILKRLHTDPRWKALLEKIGLNRPGIAGGSIP